MRKKLSLITCIVIAFVLSGYRISYFKLYSQKPFVCTTWDALGYYFYLPSVFIYHDASELKWFPKIDSTYSVSGGKLYQAGKCKNGNYVFNYYGGVAIMQSPFFFTAHILAPQFNYVQDGFSPPYQFAVAIAAVFYCVLGIFLLRKILLRFFDDISVSITLLLLALASNFIQYVSMEGAMSHSFIFSLYVLVIYSTVRWHEHPKIFWACLTGFAMGLTVISRPTEIIIFFIPLLWNTHTKESSKLKWRAVSENKIHLLFLFLAGFIAALPQMIYWKLTAGSFIYDVGSKWQFLNPFFRVLFGWEKGWFIYTPVAILFVTGLFFIKKFPFKNSAIVFCLLNIWIIIAWYDWRYGASYSCRALVQSYPVFALPLAAIVQHIIQTKWKYLFFICGAYLIFVNLFQLKQYNETILHYNDMNRKYYAHIYLNSHPSSLDMSLLDTDEFLSNEKDFEKNILLKKDSTISIHLAPNSTVDLYNSEIKNNSEEAWLKIESEIKFTKGTWGAYLISELQQNDSVKQNKIRIQNAISPLGEKNQYAFYVKVPSYFKNSKLKLSINSPIEFDATIFSVNIFQFTKKSTH